jgi:hypothetical protein
MDELIRVILENRYSLFGLAVLAEQSGLPVPTAPVLLGAGDDQVEIAVAIVVGERGPHAEAIVADARRRADIGESSTVVYKQPVRAIVGEIQVGVTVRVVVPPGDPFGQDAAQPDDSHRVGNVREDRIDREAWGREKQHGKQYDPIELHGHLPWIGTIPIRCSWLRRGSPASYSP